MGPLPSSQRLSKGRLAGLAIGCAGVALACVSESEKSELDESPTLPNIVIVYADDFGYGDLGAQNPESRIPTPHLDRLAAEGMRFTDAHSSSGICTPSRYALLTGRHHWRDFHGIVGVFEGSVFEAERLTLPEMLRERGYRTACIGKWHLGWDWEAIRTPASSGERRAALPGDFDWSQPIPDGPLAHGFDHYFGDDVPNFPPYTWIEDERVTKAPSVALAVNPVPDEGSAECRPGPMAEGWRLDEVMPTLTDRAVAWIERAGREGQPFFLYFPWTSPHAPIVPSEAFKGSSEAGPYGDFVTQSDAALGRVLDALARTGAAENTLVIFTSDNGPEHYAYPRSRDFAHHSTGPLRGLKRDIWEGGHRVPMLVRWPGVVEAGTVCDSLVAQVDLMSTLAAAVEFQLPDDCAEDSLDLTPLLRGGAGPRTTLVHNTRKDHYAIREDNWLLIDAPSGDLTKVPAWYAEEQAFEEPVEPAALYDLDADLGQRRNRFAEEPERVEAMRRRLVEIRQSKRTRPATPHHKSP